MKKKLLALALALTMALSLAACGGDSSNADSTGETSTEENSGASGTAFKVGVIGPMTGGAAIYGTCVANSAQIAVDEINALGGDIQFELMVEDDVNDAETSLNAYNALMDDGMQILVGTVTTTPALNVVPQAYEDRVFTITPSASGDDVIENNDNVFQICFTDSNQGSRSAQYINEHFPDAKIAIIYKNDDQYSIGIRDNFKAEADARGMSVVYEGTFTEASQTDFNVQLAAAQSAGADLLFLPIYYTPASVILTQANAMGYAPTFFGVDGMDGILTAENFDASLAEGVYLLTPFSADAEDEMTQNFVAEYQDRFGEIPNQFGADAYDAIYTLYQAIQAAGVTADMSNEEICDALIEVMPTLAVTGLTSAGSEMTWDENGAVSKDPTAVIIENGTYVTP
ncbi:MAG TPA: ABC transporter substrate-binding protein [Candidatus Oscillibacter pullicola]|mgnify:CR=1 FL=1|uniref:ABC transporter substrate-binding protein n=1 Tax=Dysosmobacter sp. TaxID=2591382 RepID=UPI001F8F8208|nr:ABC transporter substrate-binding protein [Candidatus Oscillibacter pullicola]